LHPRLNENRTRLLARLAAAALAAGRAPEDVELLAVTKSVPSATAMELFDLGCQDLGENRADALVEKHAAFLATGRLARWHFIGHLQRNKARRVLRVAHAIHSVDSPELYDTLARCSEEEGRAPGIYLQLKLADEAAKGGLDPAALPELLARAVGGPLPLLGLMTMAPLTAEPGAARAVFERLAALALALSPSAFVGGRVRLSMGMSQDFEEAVRAGATTVRIGSQLFEGTSGADERRSA
jgi:pyridoxal phosphate enzyme (YggS family)